MAHYVLAKYGEISHMVTFRTEIVDLRRGEKVILRSERGTEVGVIVHPAFESETPPEPGILGEILRRVTREDLERVTQIEGNDDVVERKYCEERIAFHQLPMRLVDVEHIFGGEKIIFYFLAEGRVDFRQLVKDLAKEYRTRIELKQIGVRDEARLLADYDHCGHEICCRMFIRELEPVTMKMAKAQKATLDPSKISGRCGRLMCCLRYEDQVYEEMKKQLPRKGSRVVTERGTAEVIDYEILSQTLRVEMPDGHIVKVHMKDVKQVIPRDEKEWQRRQQERAQQRSQQQQAQGEGKEGDRPRRPQGRGRPDAPQRPREQGAPGAQGAAQGAVQPAPQAAAPLAPPAGPPAQPAAPPTPESSAPPPESSAPTPESSAPTPESSAPTPQQDPPNVPKNGHQG
jgi:cell fate regulator YaaT (PSP1 superfamily)